MSFDCWKHETQHQLPLLFWIETFFACVSPPSSCQFSHPCPARFDYFSRSNICGCWQDAISHMTNKCMCHLQNVFPRTLQTMNIEVMMLINTQSNIIFALFHFGLWKYFPPQWLCNVPKLDVVVIAFPNILGLLTEKLSHYHFMSLCQMKSLFCH